MVSGASAIGGKKRGVQIGGGGGSTALQAAQAETMEHLKMRETWAGLDGDTPQTLQAASNARELQAAIDRYQVKRGFSVGCNGPQLMAQYNAEMSKRGRNAKPDDTSRMQLFLADRPPPRPFPAGA